MAFTFRCGVCGEEHEGLPDIAYNAPELYLAIPDDERDQRCFLNADLCVIDGEHYFLRGVIKVPIRDFDDSFGWGAWACVSEPDFQRHLDLWDAEDVSGESPFPGRLANSLRHYPETLDLTVAVVLQNDGMRPFLQLVSGEHPLAVDQRDGISIDRAVELAGKVLHSGGDSSLMAG